MNTKLTHNPFAGIPDSEISDIIVPRFELQYFQNILDSNSKILIEFKGKKGRGKTTHLRWLASQHPECPIYNLEKHFDLRELEESSATVVFIDGIHNLSIKERIQLYRSKKTVVFTTHTSRKLESKLVGAKLISIPFKGITNPMLNAIVNRRIKHHNLQYNQSIAGVSDQQILEFSSINKDDIRSTINSLYDQYQST